MTLEEVKKLAPLCDCDECNHGCKMGAGFFARGEEKKVAEKLGIPLKQFKEKYLKEVEKFNTKLFRPKIKSEKPFGKCIFFDGKCTINDVKPTECRISMGCKEYGSELNQWFLLNHFVNSSDPESIRQWAIYLKFNKPIKGGSLEELVPKNLKEILSFKKVK